MDAAEMLEKRKEKRQVSLYLENSQVPPLIVAVNYKGGKAHNKGITCESTGRKTYAP